MGVANQIKRLCGNLLRRHRVEDSLDAEVRAYVEELTDRSIFDFYTTRSDADELAANCSRSGSPLGGGRRF